MVAKFPDIAESFNDRMDASSSVRQGRPFWLDTLTTPAGKPHISKRRAQTCSIGEGHVERTKNHMLAPRAVAAKR